MLPSPALPPPASDCSPPAPARPATTRSATTGSPTTGGPETVGAVRRRRAPRDEGDFSVEDPGPLKGKLLTPDVLVRSTETIPESVREELAGLEGVDEVMPLSIASLSSNGRTLTIAAVDPGDYRRFTPDQSALADEVWSRVAGGEVAVDPSVGKKLEEPKGYLTLGTQEGAPEVHIGAYAPMVKSISAVVARPRGEQMGMQDDNALLVSTGALTPSVLTAKMQKILGKDATLQVLALEFDVDVPQTAVLTGTTAAEAVGSFSYTPHADGRVSPDPKWVAANIRTEAVPLLGNVTCHRVMLPQLRAALSEIVDARAGGQDPPRRVRRLLLPALHRLRPGQGTVPALVGHRGRPQRAGQPAWHRRRDGPRGRQDLQAVGLRLGRRLELHRPHALRARQHRQVRLEADLGREPGRRPAFSRVERCDPTPRVGARPTMRRNDPFRLPG